MRQKDLRPENFKKRPFTEDEKVCSEDGVDLTLIRWMLSMTPTERLQILQQNIRSILRLRGDKAHS